MPENKTAQVMRLEPKTQNDAQGDEARNGAWRLSEEVIRHIEVVFTSQASLCKLLGTNPKTWRDLTTGQGVRETTAKTVAINFVDFIDGVAEGKIAPDRGAFRESFANRLHAVYAPYITSYDFSALIRKIS